MATGRKSRQLANTWIRNCILIHCCLGILVSAYAYYVETAKEQDKSYKALCDISERISCSKVFTSRWGRGFGLVEKIFGRNSTLNQPNSVFGIAFYCFQTILALDTSTNSAVASLGLAAVANAGSVYLGYILLYVLNDICVVCVTMYVVNFIILVASIFKYRQAVAIATKKRS